MWRWSPPEPPSWLMAPIKACILGGSCWLVDILKKTPTRKIGGNFFKLSPTPWLIFLSGFGGILLTFLAGAEVDLVILREKAKESLLIGGFSFFAPFLSTIVYCHWIAHWSLNASLTA